MAFTTKRSRKETESKSYLFLLELCVKFGSLQACSAFLKELNGKKTHEESLDFMYKTLEKHKLFQNRFKRDEKCDLMANQFKLLGNVHFAEGDYKRALKLYTRAIMGAKGQEMLAVCYANRSAVLFKLGLYEECLVDIERALSNNYPNRLKPKLVSRRAKALELKKQEPRVSFHEKAPKIPTFRRNSSFPCATNSVSIVVGDKSRKHVVATKDIQVGEVIAVETPFTAVITPFLLFHCCDCFTLCYNPIPCNSCTETVYCSETCRENAFTKYHKKECPILRSIKELIGNDSRHFHYALKMAFYAQEKHISHASKCCDRQDFVDDSTMTLMATLFYYLVETYTTALQGVGEAGVKDFKKALMSYMHICEHHISDISEVYLNDGINNELSLYKDDFAKAIYPFCGQLRHSCCPNVNGWYHGVTKVLRAVRTIKKGEECFVSYGPLYSVMGRKDRQNYLFFIYNFKCRCQACKQNWYLKEDLSAEEALVNHMLLFNNNKFHVDVAKALINRKIQLVKELEKSEPNDELIHQQTTLFNCFLVLANKRVPFLFLCTKMSVASCIAKVFKKLGQISTFVQFQSQLLACVQDDTRNSGEFVRDFHKLGSNVEKVDFLYDKMRQYGLLDDKYTKDEKDDKKAKKHKEKGDKLFATGAYSKALQCYTRSVMKAKSPEVLAMAYANRSAALFKLEQFEEALSDVERALSGDYPENLKPSLVTRREKLLGFMGAHGPAFNFFESVPEIPEDQKNASIPGASSCIEIKPDEKSRRRVFAARKIEIGEIIAVEKPFTFTLAAADLYHCHECYQLCYNPIPCEICSQSLYCGEECRENAREKYHQYECPILISLKNMVGKHKAFLLAIKMSFIIPDEDDAPEVYALVENLNRKNSDEVFTTALIAALMYHLVKTYTGKFPEDDSEAENKFKHFLMIHLRICLTHAAGIDELCPNQASEGQEPGQELLRFKSETVGCALYPFYALFRHVCCPNVFAHHHGTKRVLRAIRTIQEGQECFVSYGPYYVEHSKEERQNRLLSQYHFNCKCKACEEDWPQLDLNPYYLTSRQDLEFVAKIRDANVEAAIEEVPRFLRRLKELEVFEPLSELTLQQKLLSYCYDILGNKRRIL
ncbi:uncharacterized protein LOC123004111 [Tribolium madens]|uniref:uncharacterized protein LOC123004111 n=1 Tax=Tribolium madens TaxID=41895 RepID=UPI001CF73B88|nr:uncharacterized protein LOC123004111 [Tribolium madens]